MNETSDYVYNLLLQSFQTTFQSLTAKIDEDVAHENKTDESKHPLTKVKADLDKWARLIPVIGYNSWSYDLNLIKRWIFPLLITATTCPAVPKRGNSFLSVKIGEITFFWISIIS